MDVHINVVDLLFAKHGHPDISAIEATIIQAIEGASASIMKNAHKDLQSMASRKISNAYDLERYLSGIKFQIHSTTSGGKSYELSIMDEAYVLDTGSNSSEISGPSKFLEHESHVDIMESHGTNVLDARRALSKTRGYKNPLNPLNLGQKRGGSQRKPIGNIHTPIRPNNGLPKHASDTAKAVQSKKPSDGGYHIFDEVVNDTINSLTSTLPSFLK